MKRALTGIIMASTLLLACKSEKKDSGASPAQINLSAQDDSAQSVPEIIPVSHATAVVEWDDKTIYVDPVGGNKAFADYEKPDIVFITDVHGDHLDPQTLSALKLGDTPVVVPEAVKKKLPDSLDLNYVVMENGEKVTKEGFAIEAIPMYNLREEAKKYHPKGRGNGYVLERDGKRLYIAGDTEDIPEMRQLRQIDIALVPMNLPYTMPVGKAADAVLDFAPKKVYPYHFRGKEGKADVKRFKYLVTQGNKEIEVVLAEWYPEEQDSI